MIICSLILLVCAGFYAQDQIELRHCRRALHDAGVLYDIGRIDDVTIITLDNGLEIHARTELAALELAVRHVGLNE